MTQTLDRDTPDTPDSVDFPAVDPGSVRGPRALTIVLVAILVVALAVGAGAVGWLVRGGTDEVSATSVDAGFARDMATHHTQAVIMAGYARDHTTDPAVKNLAYDIESSQNSQVGEMTGWLDSWGLSRSSTVPMMSWMGGDDMASMGMSTSGGSDGALMPGMATTTELNTLLRSSGKQLDVLFLQLMIRHHQGGIDMARYAATHAHFAYVRQLAQSMVNNQSAEVTQMTSMLSALGARPLPFTH